MNPSAAPLPSTFIEHLAFWIVVLWTGGTMAVYFLSVFNIPVLVSFSAHRITQLRDSKFDLRPTLPNFAALHYFCAIVYGVLYPSFYFFAARTRHEMGIWYLGAHTNTWWTIALGAVCIAWLLSNVIESILRWDRLRFFPTWPSRIMAGLALALTLRFHWMTIMAAAVGPARPVQPGGPPYYFQLFHPQTCFLAATLVYLFAFLETSRPAAIPRPRRQRLLGGALGAAATLVLFAPFWLSLPRVPHGQAMKMLNDHRGLIAQISAEARIDPKLLAGVIYVAHTRDHPRFTGDLIELLSQRLRLNDVGLQMGGVSAFNASTGLAQVRDSTVDQTIGVMHWHFGIATHSPGKTAGGTPMERMGTREWQRGFEGNPLFWESIRLRSPVPVEEALIWKLRRGSDIEARRTLAHDPELSLAIGSAMLAILQNQWREAGFAIDDKPEITATLYNLGYERSHPHGDPKPNDFGRRALKFMSSPEAKALFPDPRTQTGSESDAEKSDAR